MLFVLLLSTLAAATSSTPNRDTLDHLLSAWQNATGGQEVAAAVAPFLQPYGGVHSVVWTADERSPMDVAGAAGLLQHLADFPKDYHRKVGRVLPSSDGQQFLVFYEDFGAPQTPGEGDSWVGCDVVTMSAGRVSGIRFQTHSLARHLGISVNSSEIYDMLDREFVATTTASNRVGIRKLVETKRAHIGTAQRINDSLAMMREDTDLLSWEEEGLRATHGKTEFVDKFLKPGVLILPDFYEGLESYIVVGNAVVLQQIPSGTLNESGRGVFCAWPNSDMYFFTGTQISQMMFMRDTLVDYNCYGVG
eukprot:TRINITY_DN60605_c0_g1_i2.p1 TRINITY_DN60605_c0_g1~~TRINITY_DN60605_c0_g1_i2.p1  ORF type:complete len:306 (+),score=67.03 TRINITY_DN60605_c0_g1_i2:178-1095(+)